MPKLNSLEVVHQDTNKDSYENLHDIIVSLKGARNQEMIDGEARAAYEVLLEMYVNDKEAFARRIETLKAEFGNSLAQVIEEMLAYASASEAYAKKITTVSAEVGNNRALVQQEMFARATADEALASLITTLSATVGNNTAAITTEQTVRATADEALATSISTLSATVGSKTRTYAQTTAPTGNSLVPLAAGDLWFDTDDNFKLYRYTGSTWTEVADARIAANTAAITTEQTARVNGDSALASQINTVVARLDTGDFAAVKTESSATASKVLGIEAKWGVTTNVNGQVAGIQLLNGTNTQSSFTVDATKFIVKKPDGTNGIVWNGSLSRLDVSGDIYANNLYGTVVNTGNVVNNAITGSAVAYGTNPSVTLTTTGGRVIIQAFGVHTDPSSGGVIVGRSGGWASNSLIGEGRFTFMYTEVLGAGSRTFYVSNGSEATLLVYELKR